MDTHWNLIPLNVNSASMNMALDESLLVFRSQNKIPDTLRLYRWNPSAVSIGYFQSLEDTVNLKSCRKLNIDVIRRITGGGAVYHDYHGEITYCIVVKQDNRDDFEDALNVYRFFCGAIIEGLSILGLKAKLSGVNDIVVNSKKISGNAQTRKFGVILQHGTILVDLDVHTMFQLLRITPEKISDKHIISMKERVTSINQELGATVRFTSVEKALIRGFEKKIGAHFSPTNFPDELLSQVNVFEEKYLSNDWLYLR